MSGVFVTIWIRSKPFNWLLQANYNRLGFLVALIFRLSLVFEKIICFEVFFFLVRADSLTVSRFRLRQYFLEVEIEAFDFCNIAPRNVDGRDALVLRYLGFQAILFERPRHLDFDYSQLGSGRQLDLQSLLWSLQSPLVVLVLVCSCLD